METFARTLERFGDDVAQTIFRTNAELLMPGLSPCVKRPGTQDGLISPTGPRRSTDMCR
jgi:hypothetical protein